MSDFKVIETQEQFDNIIKERLDRANKKHKEEVETLQNQLSELQTQLEASQSENVNLTKTIEDAKSYSEENEQLKAQIKANEIDSVKTKIALENGLSYNAVKYVQGDDTESITDSVNELKSMLNLNSYERKSSEAEITSETKEEAMHKELLHSLF